MTKVSRLEKCPKVLSNHYPAILDLLNELYIEIVSLRLRREVCERRIQALIANSAFNVFVKANTVLSYKLCSIYRLERIGRYSEAERFFNGLKELLALSSRYTFFALEKLFTEAQTR